MSPSTCLSHQACQSKDIQSIGCTDTFPEVHPENGCFVFATWIGNEAYCLWAIISCKWMISSETSEKSRNPKLLILILNRRRIGDETYCAMTINNVVWATWMRMWSRCRHLEIDVKLHHEHCRLIALFIVRGRLPRASVESIVAVDPCQGHRSSRRLMNEQTRNYSRRTSSIFGERRLSITQSRFSSLIISKTNR